MRNKLLTFLILAPLALRGACTSNQTPASGTINGAQYLIYMPQPASCFNGEMIIFAHGYVQPGAPPGTWTSQLAIEKSLPAECSRKL